MSCIKTPFFWSFLGDAFADNCESKPEKLDGDSDFLVTDTDCDILPECAFFDFSGVTAIELAHFCRIPAL
jgi:hypothetical protein